MATATLPRRPAGLEARFSAADLEVRPARAEDWPGLLRLYRQPHIVRGTSAPPFAGQAQLEAWLGEAEGHGWLLAAAAGPEVIGALALKTNHDPLHWHAGELARVAVAAEWQGQGVGSRLVAAALNLADNWLNLYRVELMARADNPAALALYRRHGFVEEGRLRGYGFRDGEFLDVIAMARLRGPLKA